MLHTGLSLIAALFVLANVWAYLDWAHRGDEARYAAESAALRLQGARRAIAQYPAQIAALEASAARLTAARLLVSADYDTSRANVLRARVERARAILAA